MAHELLLCGGPVRVPLAGGRVHEALLIRDGRIAALGCERDVAGQAGPGAKRVALEGRCLLPAFADAHVHLSSLGALLGEVSLRRPVAWPRP